MVTRERLHQLVDQLPDDELDEIAQFIEQRQPSTSLFDTLMAAAIDDELETPEEAAAVSEAYADIAAGRVVDHEEALRRLARSSA